MIGNHDVINNPEVFIELLGGSYYSFFYQSSAFIFLDAITNDGRIEGEQLVWLNKQIEIIDLYDSIVNVFVFSHKPIWYDCIKEMGAFDDRYVHRFNFTKVVKS